jgi:hypothetical protein
VTGCGQCLLHRYRGANSYHNSNRMTFMRVPAWRAMLSKPGATAPYLRRGAALTYGPCCQSDRTWQPAKGCLLTCMHALHCKHADIMTI